MTMLQQKQKYVEIFRLNTKNAKDNTSSLLLLSVQKFLKPLRYTVLNQIRVDTVSLYTNISQ